MRMEDILKDSCVIADLKGKTKDEVLLELVDTLKKVHLVEDTEKAVSVILEREKLGSTGIGDGVAIPHGKMKGLHSMLCAFGKSKEGLDFDAVDSKPVHLFFLLLAPEDSASLHLKTLSRISKLLRDPSFRKRLTELSSSREMYNAIIEEDGKN
jgi:PTS system nitrogen regulatory IIA component